MNEENPEKYLWQSFDYPFDTWLPGMKVGWDLRTGLKRRLTAWKSPDDPSPGKLGWGIELHEYPEIVMKKGSNKFFRTGLWNGRVFSGVPELRATPVYDFSFVSNKDEVYFMFHMIKTSLIPRAVMNQTQLNMSATYGSMENGSGTYIYQETTVMLTIYVGLMEIVSLVSHLHVNVYRDSSLSHQIHGTQTSGLRDVYAVPN